MPSREKCQELFYESSIREFADFHYMKIHRLKVDAYSLQHPDIYMVSAKSFAAHLVGMGIAMEYNNDQRLMRALQKWLNGKRVLEKPPMLEYFGSITIADVMKAKSADEYEWFVMDWAKCVWDAYAIYPIFRTLPHHSSLIFLPQ
ncbi:MAG: DUF5946 family protein [Candidatus Methanoperedens sp.]|nr:DUF5946 family protein [Candidatus Methanoperedens sp.]